MRVNGKDEEQHTAVGDGEHRPKQNGETAVGLHRLASHIATGGAGALMQAAALHQPNGAGALSTSFDPPLDGLRARPHGVHAAAMGSASATHSRRRGPCWHPTAQFTTVNIVLSAWWVAQPQQAHALPRLALALSRPLSGADGLVVRWAGLGACWPAHYRSSSLSRHTYCGTGLQPRCAWLSSGLADCRRLTCWDYRRKPQACMSVTVWSCYDQRVSSWYDQQLMSICCGLCSPAAVARPFE